MDAPTVAPAFREHPTRLFVESTSRCNLGCVMCMKQAPGCGITDGDLQPATFAALEPAFPNLEALVLNGVGEPLLTPGLEQFISRARTLMPAYGWIGFQSNGLLMTNIRAVSLVNAGVDRVCLSMDGASPDTFRAIREGGKLNDLEWALSALTSAKVGCGRPDLEIGVEFVLMRENLRELPAALRWAAARGVTFALVSHVLPYDEAHAGECAYDLCTDEALSLFHVWKDKAELAGVAIHRYYELLFRFDRTPEEQRIVSFVEAIRTDAQNRGITLDLKRLFALDYGRLADLAEVFEEAREVARETGLDLRLPQAAPRERKQCHFVEQGGAFVSWDGGVHPCYYLWHPCRSWATGWLHPVRPRLFGNLVERGILDIWNGAEFRAYRENVLRYDYPYCPGCSFAPCDYVQAENFEQDCYVNTEPCGSCLWSAGMFQCLS
ncbi:radical SAM protein [Geobacter pickeringii]|uniref:Radical SAM protein n=2 Tax=Geobacter pickeringii TaxID=345632 RepID=A0A0B5BDN5_9BACT|nr:radical SAM protein [Geobacter pickeringii]